MSWANIAGGGKSASPSAAKSPQPAASGTKSPQSVAPTVKSPQVGAPIKSPQGPPKKEEDKNLDKEFQKIQIGHLVDASKINPSQQELADLSKACTALWELDYNRLIPGKDYELDLQHGKKPYQEGDAAPNPLFKWVDKAAFSRPTYKAFHVLLDNYERSTGVQETVTKEEKVENATFLREILKTAPMIYLHKYLVAKKVVSSNIEQFLAFMSELWFGLYSRQTKNDSSGFEHVFVGEERDGKVMGMHNWVQLYMEEQKKKLDYKGYIFPRDRRPLDHQNEQVITIQFSWGKELKPVSTSFIGVSPEFEVALYTLCFLVGKETNDVVVGPYKLQIKTFSYGYGQNRKLGTSFPEM